MQNRSFLISLLISPVLACSGRIHGSGPAPYSAAEAPLYGLGGCLLLPNGGSAGTPLQLGPCNDPWVQRFREEAPAMITTEGMCLDVLDGDPSEGTPVSVWPCHWGENQHWERTAADELLGFAGHCLDLTTATSIAVMTNCDGRPTEQWSLGEPGGTGGAGGTGGTGGGDPGGAGGGGPLGLLGGSADAADAIAYPPSLPPPLPRARPTDGVALNPWDDIQEAVDSHGAGTVFLLSAGVFHAQHVVPQKGDEFYGVSATDTVLDGDATEGGAFTCTAGSSDVTIANLAITNYTVPIQTGVVDSNMNWVPWADTPEPCPRWYIYNNDISGNHDGAGIQVGSYSVVRDNRFYDNGQLGFGGGGSGSIISYNDIGWNNTDHWDLSGWGSGGVKMSVLDADQTFEHNYVHNTRNGGKGVWWDVSNRNAHIQRNIVVNNEGAGIVAETAKDGCTISENVTVHNGYDVPDWAGWAAGVVLSTSLRISVSNNVSFDNAGPQLSIITQDRPDGPGGGSTLVGNRLGPGLLGFSSIVQLTDAAIAPDSLSDNVTLPLDQITVPTMAVGPQADGY
jgi:parallel beta-helix repeat protein